MTLDCRGNFIRAQSRRFALVGLAGLVLTTAPASGDEPKKSKDRPRPASREPGYVDPAPFLELVGEDDDVIQVSLDKSIIKVAAAALSKKNAQISRALEQIAAINAVITKADDRAEARSIVSQTAERLQGDGWTQMARVRQKEDADVNVLVKQDGETLIGIVAMVFEPGEGQLVFANIAGKLDLELIAEIASQLDIPGLDALGETRREVVDEPAESRHEPGEEHDEPPKSKPREKSRKGGR